MSTPGAGWASPIFQMSKRKTLAVPMEIHALNRIKLSQILKDSAGVVLLKGGEEQTQYDSDTELLFRQDSWFNYLFGVKEPGMFGAISVTTGKATLFIPKLPDSYRIWCGAIYPPEYFKSLYAVDEVLYADDVKDWLRSALELEGPESSLHLLEGVNSDSGVSAQPASFEGIEEFSSRVNKTVLHHALSTVRVTKSALEIDLMRWCALVASNAHVKVMRSIEAGLSEYELEATFLYDIYKTGGCRRSAYTSICACGPNGATLHYGHAGAPNDRELLQSDMALLDMGAEYHGYVSDITCSYPVSGRFTADQRAVYEGVLAAQRAVLDAMRPGVEWSTCHKLAERAILQALLEIGVIVAGSSLEDLEAANIGAIFFPHGLGHLIGCDVHDVGGYIEGTPRRSDRPGLSKLRTARVLEQGMALTNEPGCYFIDALIDAALANPEQARFLDAAVLGRFRSFGGVRLEDVVVVTADGVDNLTTCPRTVSEIESVMAGGAWPPSSDEAPYLRRKWVKLSADCTALEVIPIHA